MPILEVTTMIGCPLMCTFCPQPELKSAYEKKNDSKNKDNKYLSLENFKKILARTPKHVVIDFGGMSEPWANRNCTAMLRHALECGFTIAIHSTLYGMSAQDAEQVVDLLRKYRSQVDVICLHLADAEGNMKGFKYSAEWEAVFKQFEKIKADNICKKFEMMTMDRSGVPLQDLRHLNLDLPGWQGNSRAESLDKNAVSEKSTVCISAPHHNAAVSCAVTPFYDHNVVLPNGDVLLCCMDYNLKHVIGNLLTQEYYDIFCGVELNRVRTVNMKPEFSDQSICKVCVAAVDHSLGDDLHIQKDEMLAEYKSYIDAIKASPWLHVTPRPLLRPIAELLLTIGRVSSYHTISKAGLRAYKFQKKISESVRRHHF